MHKYLTILYSTALLVACSTAEDPIIPSPEPGDGLVAIGFASDMSNQESATRATSLGKDFVVYGYKTMTDATIQNVFDDVLVSYNPDSAKYYYVTSTQPARYWDLSAQSYRFWAYVDGNSTQCHAYTKASAVADADQLTFTGGLDCLDEIYYSHINLRNPNDSTSIVTLTFKKPYCMVRVMFLDKDKKAIEPIAYPPYTFGPVSGSIATKGTITITYPKDGAADSEQVSLSATETTSTITPSGPNYHVQFPMGVQSDYQLVALDQDINVDKKVTVPAEKMNWQANHKYTYKFIMAGDAFILYDVTVEAWKGDTYTGTITQW